MSTKKNTEIIQKQLEYLHIQLERFLTKYYGITLFKADKLYGNKNLKKERKYGKSTFFPDGHVEIDLNYDMLLGNVEDKEDRRDRKGLMLRTIFREGVRIALARSGRQFQDNSPDFEEELKKHDLKSYGNLPETGMYFNTYICSRCERVQALTVKKIPPSKDPSSPKNKDKFRTSCCQSFFYYKGLEYLSHNEIKKYYDSLNAGKEIVKLNEETRNEI